MKENKFLQTIDKMNEWVGHVASWAYIGVMLIQVMEVILRRFFNSPTIWAWDVNAQLFMGATILGGGYVLLHDSHVRIDLLWARVSPKKRAIFDLISFPLTIIGLGLMTWQLARMTLDSWEIREHTFSLFEAPVYPLKTVYLIGVFLLLLQAIAYAFRSFRHFRDQDAAEKGDA